MADTVYSPCLLATGTL